MREIEDKGTEHDPCVRKAAMRKAHGARRAALRLNPSLKRQLDEAIVHHTLELVGRLSGAGRNIAAYNPLPSEPGPADFAQALLDQARTVFLPVSLPDGTLAWAEADSALKPGALKPGALGVAEPTGARYNSNVLRSCGLVVVPALAVDKQGMRLGKGAGYYDRALACIAGAGVRLAAVVYEDEVVASVPAEAHDRPVDFIVSPSGIFPV